MLDAVVRFASMCSMSHPHTPETVRAYVINMFNEMLVREDTTLSSAIEADLGTDSLDMVEVCNDLDEEYNITIPDAVVEKFRTVGDVCDYVMQQVTAEPADVPIPNLEDV